MNRKNSSGRLVWSSESGRQTQNPQKPIAAPENDGIVRISRQTKGRKGKGVTLITGVPLEGSDLKNLARELKQRCGTGGTIKNGIIEIQGDHRDLLCAELSKNGWTVKKAGN